MAKTPNGVNYAGNVFVKNKYFGVFACDALAKHCPQKMIDFLEENINFTVPSRSMVEPIVVLNSTPIQGPPLEILGKFVSCLLFLTVIRLSKHVYSFNITP